MKDTKIDLLLKALDEQKNNIKQSEDRIKERVDFFHDETKESFNRQFADISEQQRAFWSKFYKLKDEVKEETITMNIVLFGKNGVDGLVQIIKDMKKQICILEKREFKQDIKESKREGSRTTGFIIIGGLLGFFAWFFPFIINILTKLLS